MLFRSGELVENLGTIAHSGTKAFLKQLAEEKKPDVGLIGQFGVGFYSAFMVAKKVTVLSRSFAPDETGWQWTSEGMGGYELAPAADLPRGTRITLELKDDARDFAQESTVERIIQRYSSFVPFPIELNTKRLNTVQAIWARNKNEIKEEEYHDFYTFVGMTTTSRCSACISPRTRRSPSRRCCSCRAVILRRWAWAGWILR